MTTIRRMSKSLFGEGRFQEPPMSQSEIESLGTINSIYESVIAVCGQEY
jgi:hypothetical protein